MSGRFVIFMLLMCSWAYSGLYYEGPSFSLYLMIVMLWITFIFKCLTEQINRIAIKGS
jgi:cobalamin biosynthesis protein CobD/CbiB